MLIRKADLLRRLENKELNEAFNAANPSANGIEDLTKGELVSYDKKGGKK